MLISFVLNCYCNFYLFLQNFIYLKFIKMDYSLLEINNEFVRISQNSGRKLLLLTI